MCSTVDAREVLAYLNELGYKNITAQQLKEFMKDLKKLIKYENTLKQKHTGQAFNRQENLKLPSSSSITTYEPMMTRTNVISVEIKKPHKHTCRFAEEKNDDMRVENNVPPIKDNSDKENSVPGSKTSNIEILGSTESLKSVPHNDKTKCSLISTSLKPKTSFIRPKFLPPRCKSDPVALYHKYQSEWKKQRLPGESSHSDLRWAIREKMLGEQPRVMSAPTSIHIMSRKRCGSSRI